MAEPLAFVPVIVNAVAPAITDGVPVKAPVEVLKVVPVGAAGEMLKDAIAPPVLLTVNPVITVFWVLDSDELERVKAGAANTTGQREAPL